MEEHPIRSAQTVAVLNNQSAIEEATAAACKLEQAIADYAHTAEEMRASLPDASAFEQERENLLAAIAIGEKGQADLDALDARLAQTRQQARDAQPGITGIAQTIAGLKRRLVDVQAKLQGLREERPALLRSLLLSEAEAEGAEYAGLAVALVNRYRRLKALETLLHGHGMSIGVHGPGLHLPAFDLESVLPHVGNPLPGTGQKGAIFDLRWEARQRQSEQLGQEKAHLRSLGVLID